jgi:hypothetical protein
MEVLVLYTKAVRLPQEGDLLSKHVKEFLCMEDFLILYKLYASVPLCG